MSILSKLYNFIKTSSEDLSVATTVATVSDTIDLQAANLGDGATDLYFVAECVSGTTAVGTAYTVELTDCDTTGGSYVAAASKLVSHVAGTLPVGEAARIKLPAGLRRFVRARIVAGAGETGTSLWRARIAMS